MGIVIGLNSGRRTRGSSSSVKQVEVLPESGETGIIYLVPATDPSDGDQYVEYVYVNNKWEIYGSDILAISTTDTTDYGEDIFSDLDT